MLFLMFHFKFSMLDMKDAKENSLVYYEESETFTYLMF